jgi:prepilin-type N-terminal cleavage/methylation domain-containing protein
MQKPKIKNQKSKNSRGFTLVEVIIACSIISVTVLTLMSAASKGIELSNRALRQTQANMLLEEGTEAIKTIRDIDWTTVANLTPGTNYYLFFNTTTNVWSLNTSSTASSGLIPTYPIDSIFTRKVVVSAVNRDSNGDIAGTGTLDGRTKKITVTVSWLNHSETISKSLVFYLADIFN